MATTAVSASPAVSAPSSPVQELLPDESEAPSDSNADATVGTAAAAETAQLPGEKEFQDNGTEENQQGRNGEEGSGPAPGAPHAQGGELRQDVELSGGSQPRPGVKGAPGAGGELLLELIRSFRGGMLRVDSNLRAAMFRAVRYLVRACLLADQICYKYEYDTYSRPMPIDTFRSFEHERARALSRSPGAHQPGCRGNPKTALRPFHCPGLGKGAVRIVGADAGNLWTKPMLQTSCAADKRSTLVRFLTSPRGSLLVLLRDTCVTYYTSTRVASTDIQFANNSTGLAQYLPLDVVCAMNGTTPVCKRASTIEPRTCVGAFPTNTMPISAV